MDKLSVHRISLKQANKAMKKPVKVVYISNPMRVKATASQFKGLVQELTGQYSDIADLSKFAALEHGGEAAAGQGSNSITDDCLVTAREELHHQRHQHQQHRGDGPRRSMGDPFDMLGDLFTPDVLENLDPFMPASPYCEPSLSVDSSRGLDMA